MSTGDDGGPGSDYGFCDLGTDCADCGLPGSRTEPPVAPPPPSPTPPMQPDEVGICTDGCRFAFDGDCDDGGVGAEYTSCDEGTDVQRWDSNSRSRKHPHPLLSPA